jgi:hypothetical protein
LFYITLSCKQRSEISSSFDTLCSFLLFWRWKTKASPEIPGRGDTHGEADGMAKDAVQEDVGTSKTNAVEEAVTAESD